MSKHEETKAKVLEFLTRKQSICSYEVMAMFRVTAFIANEVLLDLTREGAIKVIGKVKKEGKRNPYVQYGAIMNKTELIATIEEILDEGPSCASFLADATGIDVRRIRNCINAMRRDNIIEKHDVRLVAGSKVPFFRIMAKKPKQQSLLRETVQRDPLVAALFGPA